MQDKSKVKILDVSKIDGLKYLKSFLINYQDKTGNNKKWEMVSRGNYERLLDEQNNKTEYIDGMSIFAHNPEKTKVILIKEFRIIPAKYVYSLPSGVSDAGESKEQTATREFKEETGLDVEIYKYTKPRFTSVGLTNEKVATAYGIYSGTISNKYLTSEEDITAFEVDRETAINLMNNEEITERTYVMLKLFFNITDEA